MAWARTSEAILRISASDGSAAACGASVGIGRRVGAHQHVHRRKLAGRIEFVAQLPRRGPDEEICGHSFAERLHKDLVVVALNLKTVRIGDGECRHGLAEFENREMVQRRFNVTDLGLACRLRAGNGNRKHKEHGHERFHSGLRAANVCSKERKGRNRARGVGFSLSG